MFKLFYVTMMVLLSFVVPAHAQKICDLGAGTPALDTDWIEVSKNCAGSRKLSLAQVKTYMLDSLSVSPSGAAGGDLSGTYPNPTIATTVVINKPITGFVAGSGTVSATDSILQAFNKIVGNIALKANLASPTFTGTVTIPTSSGVLKTTAGVIGAAASGTDYTTPTGTETLTNKRVNPRIGTTASSGTPTPDADANDVYTITALAANATFAAPTGTPVNGQVLIIRIKDNGTARTLSYNAIYRAVGVTLPATTVLSKTLYLAMVYNSADTKWDVIGVRLEA